jgi:hypothetical protein
MKKNGSQGISVLLLINCLLFYTLLPLEGQITSGEKNTGVNLIPEEENLNVLNQWLRWNNPGSLLINYLNNNAIACYDARDREIAKLTSEDDWLSRQKFVREKLIGSIGPFPEKTPLSPRVMGVIRQDGYRIEKIIYESLPGFYVTGCLYIPEKLKGKAPAVLNVIGHNQEAFRAPLYHSICH